MSGTSIGDMIDTLIEAFVVLLHSLFLIAWSFGVGWISRMLSENSGESYIFAIFLLSHGFAEVMLNRSATDRILSLLGTTPTTLTDSFSETRVTISRTPGAFIVLLGMVAQIVVVGAILLGGTWYPTMQDASTKSVIVGVVVTLLGVIFIGRPWKKAITTLWKNLHQVHLTLSNDGLAVTHRGLFLEHAYTVKPNDVSGAFTWGLKREVGKEKKIHLGNIDLDIRQRIRSVVKQIQDNNIDNPIIKAAVPDEIKQMRESNNPLS